jgi:hypothetical protein
VIGPSEVSTTSSALDLRWVALVTLISGGRIVDCDGVVVVIESAR